MRPPRPRARAATPAGARTETRRPEEAEARSVLKPGACFGEMAIFARSWRSTDAIAYSSCTLFTIARSDFELLLDFNRDIAYKVLWCVVRLLSDRLRVTNDNLRSFLAMSMF